jgi:tetratricopeptide (TPR) repeat protein
MFPAAGRAHPLVDRGRTLYEELEYKQAAEVLARALEDGALTRPERIDALKHLGLAQATLNQHAAAAATFKRILELEPDFSLDRSTTPRILDLFERVRGTMPRPSAPPPPPVIKESELTLSHAAPAEARPGRPLEVVVNLHDPDGRAARLVLRHRGPDGGSYSEQSVPASPGAVVIQLAGIIVKPPLIEYFVQALDGAGRALAGVGSAERPLQVAVREEVKPATPVYRRWWFWTVAGVLAAGAAGATAAVLLTRPAPSSGSTSVTVTFGNP